MTFTYPPGTQWGLPKHNSKPEQYVRAPTPTQYPQLKQTQPSKCSSTAERGEGRRGASLQSWRSFKHTPGRRKLKAVKSVIINFARLTQKKPSWNSAVLLPQPLHMNTGVCCHTHAGLTRSGWNQDKHAALVKCYLKDPEGAEAFSY